VIPSKGVIPGKPSNPPFIVIDTSVLLQLVATEQITLLRMLRSEFGIQPIIVSAVESETIQILANHPKFVGKQEQFKKACANYTIRLTDRETLTGTVGADADSLLRLIDSDGRRLHQRVDRGEAYTHAAASVLNIPVATNDMSAVIRLLKNGENVPVPVVRFWDLVVLGRQIGTLDDSNCDGVRKTLAKLQESLPPCFRAQSFAAGLPEFYPRLVDHEKPIVGARDPKEKLDNQRVLFRR